MDSGNAEVPDFGGVWKPWPGSGQVLGPPYGQRTGGPMTDSQRTVAIRVEVSRIGRYAARREYEGGAEGARVRP